MSKQVVLDLPESAFSALRTDPVELGRELRLAAAAKWYELGKLSQVYERIKTALDGKGR
jgi:hypothetical protein